MRRCPAGYRDTEFGQFPPGLPLPKRQALGPTPMPRRWSSDFLAAWHHFIDRGLAPDSDRTSEDDPDCVWSKVCATDACRTMRENSQRQGWPVTVEPGIHSTIGAIRSSEERGVS